MALPHDNKILIEEKIQKAQEDFINLTLNTAFDERKIDAIEKAVGERDEKTIKLAFRSFRDRIDEIRHKNHGNNAPSAKLMIEIMNDTLRKIREKYEKFWSH